VPGNRHQVNLHCVDVQRDFTDGLGGVGVEKDLFGAADGADFGDGLDHADFVVDRHDRDQHGVFSDCRFQDLEKNVKLLEEVGGSPRVASLRSASLGAHLQIHKPIRLNRQISDIEPFLLQVPAAIQHALVFRLGSNDVLLFGLVKLGDAFDGGVVGFCGSAGKDDFFGVRSDEICYGLKEKDKLLVCSQRSSSSEASNRAKR
jgi:hypothetical protein